MKKNCKQGILKASKFINASTDKNTAASPKEIAPRNQGVDSGVCYNIRVGIIYR